MSEAGVIILSAVLKRRMKLADKAKSLFISKYVEVHHYICACSHCSLFALLAFLTNFERHYTGYATLGDK
jgi:hypothetical protein